MFVLHIFYALMQNIFHMTVVFIIHRSYAVVVPCKVTNQSVYMFNLLKIRMYRGILWSGAVLCLSISGMRSVVVSSQHRPSTADREQVLNEI